MNFQDLRILVVDDNANMRRLINTILKSVGVAEIAEAENATQALELLETFPANLVLVDYVMDGMNGVEFTQHIRSEIDSKRGIRLPIIVITGYSELWRLNEAKKAGANDFIVKPFTTKALVQRISRTMTYNMTLQEIENQDSVATGG